MASCSWSSGGSLDVVASEVGVDGLGGAVVAGCDLGDCEFFVVDRAGEYVFGEYVSKVWLVVLDGLFFDGNVVVGERSVERAHGDIEFGCDLSYREPLILV